MFKYALDLVLRRKMRTFLTSLGITIAVFLISFIIFGMQDLKGLLVNQFSTQFKPDQVIVSKTSVNILGGNATTYDTKVKEQPTLTPTVLEDITSQGGINTVQPSILISGMQILIPEKKVPYDNVVMTGWGIHREDSYFTQFTGNVKQAENGSIILAKRIADFYKFTPEEIIGMKVEISPSKAALFANRSQSMIGKKYTYTVSGVFVAGQSQNDAIISVNDAVAMQADLGGFKTSGEYLEKIGYDMLYINMDETKVPDFKTFIKDNYGYQTITSDDIISVLNSITQGLTIALVMFGSVSALVASIGIINTMIMSIYEQTREIGIIKAIGASNWQVLVIFLIQSGTIGLFGGVLGLGIIYLLMKATDGLIVAQLVKAGFNIDHFFNFDLRTALIITGVSILVGVIAGIYPAIRASRLDPVKALRYE